MADIKQITLPDGSVYNLKDPIARTSIPFGQVDSTSTSTVFTAQISGITEYYDGLTVLLKNGVVTSASGFTININGLGPKPSYSNMTTGNDVTPTAPTRDTTIFNINYTMLFIYSSDIVDGGGWICYRGYDANTNTLGYQLRTNSTARTASDTTGRYRLMFTSADGTQWVPTTNSTSTNSTAARTVNQRPIDPFGDIIYYGYTTVYQPNAAISAAYQWQQYTLGIGYSFNRTGAAQSMAHPAPVYVKCAPQSDGSAIIDADAPYVQALPSSEDGKIYIYLGDAYSATAVELRMNHPVYYYTDGGIRLWSGVNAASKSYVDSTVASISIPVTDVQTSSGVSIVSSGIATIPSYLLGDEGLRVLKIYINANDISSHPGQVNLYKDDSCTDSYTFTEIVDMTYDQLVQVGIWDGEDIAYHYYIRTFYNWHYKLTSLDDTSTLGLDLYNNIAYGAYTWYSNAWLAYNVNGHSPDVIVIRAQSNEYYDELPNGAEITLDGYTLQDIIDWRYNGKEVIILLVIPNERGSTFVPYFARYSASSVQGISFYTNRDSSYLTATYSTGQGTQQATDPLVVTYYTGYNYATLNDVPTAESDAAVVSMLQSLGLNTTITLIPATTSNLELDSSVVQEGEEL